MRSALQRAFSITLILLSAQTVSAENNEVDYSRRIEVRPFALTVDEFSSLQSDIRAYVDGLTPLSNEAISDGISSESISLETTEEDYSFRGQTVSIDTARILGSVIELDYYLNVRNRGVESVSMNFGDYSRRITVEGTEPRHVDALIGLIHKKVERQEVPLGGPMFRMLLFFIVCISQGVFSVLAGFSKKNLFRILWAVSLLVMIISPFLPAEVWWGGFRLYFNDASFLDTYSSLFTFLGLLVAIAVPVIGQIFSSRKASSTQPGEPLR